MVMDNKQILIIGAVVVSSILGILYITIKKAPTKEQPQVQTAQTQESTMSIDNNAEKRQPKSYTNPPQMQLAQNKDYKATLKTTKGIINIDLFETQTPITVNNFVFLAQDGFYNNTKFHRIIKGFMIQGGDPQGNGTGGPGYKFDNEPFEGTYTPGTIAMANAGPNTNGSQFFIMHGETPLSPNYVIFGKVSDEDSLAVVDTIANTAVTANSRGEKSVPLADVFIESIEITAE